MTTERDSTMTFCEGKYTLIRYGDGRMEALRYGEKWRDLTGDNLLAAMADAIDAHLATRDAVVSDEDADMACQTFRNHMGSMNAVTGPELRAMRAALESLASRRVAVPDAISGPGIVMSKQDVRDAYYAEGWNACRDAMLASQERGKRHEG